MSTSTTRRFDGKPRPEGVTGRRGAFTLLEVLLALSLSIVLLAAVYGAFDLYVRFTVVGHDDMEQAQIARAVLRKISADIRAVVYRPATGGSGSNSAGSSGSAGGTSDQSGSGNSGQSQSGGSSGSSGGDDGSTSGDITAVDPTAGYSRAMTGLVGDATTLVLHVARASRKSSLAGSPTLADGLAATLGDEKTVSYFLADAGADGLAGVVGDAYKKASRTAGDVQGIARLEGNRLAIQIADEQSDLDAMAQLVDLLAPEIMDLEFRYFDGIDWWESWDTAVNLRLPQAVEISLKIRRTGKRDSKPVSRRDGEPPSDVYRLTVAVPTAEPYIPLE